MTDFERGLVLTDDAMQDEPSYAAEDVELVGSAG